MNFMNLTDYLRILIRRGWIVLVAMILTAGAAFVFSKQQTPVYRATQKILIAPARNDFGLAQTLKQLMSSWVARLDAEARAKDVIDELSLDMKPGDLGGKATVSSDLNTLIISIDVDLTDGATAARVANTYGQQFKRWREQQNAPLRLEDRINAELLDYPTPGLFRPNTTINVAAGALLGILLGGAVVFVLELLDANIIRRPDDIERYLSLPVLGTLPDSE
jgi:capsular polysaccharide biosynthesis protein